MTGKNGAAAARFVSKTPAIKPSPLSDYHLAIVRWASIGKSNPEIASIMKTTTGTIEQHFYRIFNLTGTSNRTGLVSKALREGWIG